MCAHRETAPLLAFTMCDFSVRTMVHGRPRLCGALPDMYFIVFILSLCTPPLPSSSHSGMPVSRVDTSGGDSGCTLNCLLQLAQGLLSFSFFSFSNVFGEELALHILELAGDHQQGGNK